MVPDGWRATALRAALERVSRPVEVIANQRYTQIGLRSHGRGVFIKEPVEGWELGDKRVFHVEADCLVLNIVFAWEQAVGKTDRSHLGLIASHRFPMYRPRENACDIEFLRYFFLTPHGKHLLGLASPGGAGRNKTLGQKEFERLVVTLPPLPEQKKIAEILSTWDRAIETTEKLLANAEAQKRALMQQLLTGKRRLKGFEQSRWRLAKLADVSVVLLGSSPPSSAYNDAGLGMPLLQGNADIKDGFSCPRVFTTEVTQLCAPGDSLLSVRAPVGSVARSQHEACIGRGLAAVRSKKNSEQEWLHQLLLWISPTWKALAQGSTFEAIKGGDIRSFKVMVPDATSERILIGEALALQDQLIQAAKSDNRALRSQKSILMQQLLTGKRRVTP